MCCGAETGFILQRTPDVVRAPDAAFVARERIPATGVPTGFWPFASDRFTELQTRVAEYFRAGTRLVWIVEPATRTVHLYRAPHELQAFGEEDELTGGDVLPGFRCPVRRLFA